MRMVTHFRPRGEAEGRLQPHQVPLAGICKQPLVRNSHFSSIAVFWPPLFPTAFPLKIDFQRNQQAHWYNPTAFMIVAMSLQECKHCLYLPPDWRHPPGWSWLCHIRHRPSVRGASGVGGLACFCNGAERAPSDGWSRGNDCHGRQRRGIGSRGRRGGPG
jgi:hypothetical protein